MKKFAIAIVVIVAAGLTFAAGVRAGQFALKHRGIFLSESSQVRSEVCAALAAQVFVVADEIREAKAAGKSASELNRILPSRNWIYESTNDGFMIYWKLSYDDTFLYDSASDLVRGTNDFDSTTKRNKK